MEDEEARSEPEPSKSSATFWSRRVESYRDDLLKLLALGFISAVITKVYGELADRFISQPWQAVWFLLPLAGAAAFTGRLLVSRKHFRLRNPVLLFLAIYVTLFGVAASTSFLDWSRELAIFSTPAPRSWLTPVSMGDWRYWIVPKKLLTPSDIAVVTMEPLGARDPKEGRLEMVRLISVATAMKAKGVAFDFYLEGELDIDPLLCSAIVNARMPVLVGYAFSESDGDIVTHLPPKSLESCIPEERAGHLAGFVDVDRVSRLIPLRFQNDPSRPALSLRAAELLAGENLRLPSDGLLRFIEPKTAIPVVAYRNLANRNERARLTGRMLLVGEESASEMFQTPFGRKLGVMIHAEAVHSLRHGHFIERSPWWLGFLTVLVTCYLLTAYAVSGAPLPQLVLYCAVISALVIGGSALATLTGPQWFDVVYPITAIWLLLALIASCRRFIFLPVLTGPEVPPREVVDLHPLRGIK